MSKIAGQLHRPVLAWAPLAAVGLISYGLYLYHFPVITWLSPENTGLDGLPLFVVQLLVMLGLAIASYLLLEMPIRRGAISGTRALVAVPVAVVSVLVLLLVGTAGGRPMPAAAARAEFYERAAAAAPGGATRVLVAGEGEAYDLAASGGGVYQGREIRGLAVSLLFCGIVEGRVVAGSLVAPEQRCPRWTEIFRGGMESYNPRVSVLMAGRQAVFDRVVGAEVLRVGTPELARLLRARLEQAHEVLTANGTPLVLLTVPCSGPPASEAATIAAVRRDPGRLAWVNSIWRDFAAAHPQSVTLADLGEVLCPGGDPRPTVGGRPLRNADGRLSPAGVRAVWEWLAPIAERTAGPAA